MINCNNKKCFGCSACLNICPTNAICFIEQKNGFFYPYVDEKKCVGCKQCERVCPVNNPVLNDPIEYLAAKNKDSSIRINSSSGGIFSLLFKYFIEKEGSVYGASFNDTFTVIHSRACSESELSRFMGAKYVQSNLGMIFSNVKQDLENNLDVLFSGTPCQIEGLKNYLSLKGVSTSKILFCDILCHGVPSPKVWSDYLSLVLPIEQITGIEFRNKDDGWHKSKISIFNNSKRIIDENHSQNKYSKLYFNGYTVRPSCFECQYSNIGRVGDISIGDYWGIERFYPNFDDDKGVSLILINTQKGKQIFDKIVDNIDYIKIQKKECLQQSLVEPIGKPGFYELFWLDYTKIGFTRTYTRFIERPNNFLLKIRNKVNKIFRG